jgi:hypothetical protein
VLVRVGVLVLVEVRVSVDVGVFVDVLVAVGVLVGVDLVGVAWKDGSASTPIGLLTNNATINHNITVAHSGLRFTAVPPLESGAGSFPRECSRIDIKTQMASNFCA